MFSQPPTIYYFGGAWGAGFSLKEKRSRQPQFTYMNLLIPAGRLGWIAEQTSGCKRLSVSPTWWAHVWKKNKRCSISILKITENSFFSGTRFWYIVFELVSFLSFTL